jgi:hypothetical protein
MILSETPKQTTDLRVHPRSNDLMGKEQCFSSYSVSSTIVCNTSKKKMVAHSNHFSSHALCCIDHNEMEHLRPFNLHSLLASNVTTYRNNY